MIEIKPHALWVACSALLGRMRLLEVDHEPDGWPAVRMSEVTELCDAVHAARLVIMRCLDRNGGAIDGPDTIDGENYVMVRREDFDAMEALLTPPNTEVNARAAGTSQEERK